MASHEALTKDGQIGGAVTDNVPKDTEQQASSTDQLLQLAQGASGSIIQIPADVFTSLLQGLSGLQSSIADLKNENRELKHCHKTFQSFISNLNGEVRALHEAQSQANHNVQKLQVHFGMDFALFPKLPLEIQRMIWRHCANIPRIVGIKRIEPLYNHKDHVPTTLRCQLFAVCKEARTEASKTILPLENTYPLGLKNTKVPLPQIFLDPATDIVWASKLQEYPYDSVQDLVSYRVKGKPWDHKVATKVALPCDCWHERKVDHKADVMGDLQCLGTEELILVVGDDSACKSPDFVFVEPKETPKLTLGSEFLEENGFLNDDITWKEMNEAAMKFMTTFQAQRAVDRHQYFLSKSRSLSAGGCRAN
jgi:hypothetical protein